MPAAAVTPAPIAYVEIAAVKKLVAGIHQLLGVYLLGLLPPRNVSVRSGTALRWVGTSCALTLR